MGRAPVAAGDDDPFAGLLLEVIEEVDEDGVDALLASDDGKTMATAPLAIEDRLGFRCEDRGMGRAPFAPKIFSGDPRKVGLCFPWID